MAADDKKDSNAAGATPLDVEADSRYESGIAAPERGVRVEEVMSAEVADIGPERPVSEAARIMDERDVGFLPVTEEDRTVVGVVTDRDLTLRVLARKLGPETRVEEVMAE